MPQPDVQERALHDERLTIPVADLEALSINNVKSMRKQVAMLKEAQSKQ